MRPQVAICSLAEGFCLTSQTPSPSTCPSLTRTRSLAAVGKFFRHSPRESVVLHDGRDQSRPEWNLALYQLIPADELTIKGTYVEKRVTKEGIGAPLVAKRNLSTSKLPIVYCAPYLLRHNRDRAVRGFRCVISVQDPWQTSTRSELTVTAILWRQISPRPMPCSSPGKSRKSSVSSVFSSPEKYTSTFRLARMEPYDPNKTVLLVIHGLMDTPVTWVPMLNEMYADPVIRHNYQFWFYSYPSGYPYPYSALILRQELDAMEKRFPLAQKDGRHRPQHGWMHRRTLITDTGDKLWLRPSESRPNKQRCRPRANVSSRRRSSSSIGRKSGASFSCPLRIAAAISPRTGSAGSDRCWSGRRETLSVGQRRGASPATRSRSAAVEALSQQRRYAGSEQPFRHGDQSDSDHARHSLLHHRG